MEYAGEGWGVQEWSLECEGKQGSLAEFRAYTFNQSLLLDSNSSFSDDLKFNVM